MHYPCHLKLLKPSFVLPCFYVSLSLSFSLSTSPHLAFIVKHPTSLILFALENILCPSPLFLFFYFFYNRFLEIAKEVVLQFRPENSLSSRLILAFSDSMWPNIDDGFAKVLNLRGKF